MKFDEIFYFHLCSQEGFYGDDRTVFCFSVSCFKYSVIGAEIMEVFLEDDDFAIDFDLNAFEARVANTDKCETRSNEKFISFLDSKRGKFWCICAVFHSGLLRRSNDGTGSI